MKQSCQTRQRIGSILVAVGIAAGTGLAVNPPANAGPLVTIYPNYGNQHCGPGGWVRAVQVSAFPGTTNVYRDQNWAPVRANSGQNSRIVANVWCAYWWNKSGNTFKVVQNTAYVVANKSYYF